MEIQKFIDENQLKRDIAFSDTDLDSAMMSQASLFAHYGQLASRLQYQTDCAENALEITKSRVASEVRDAAAGTKITEARIAEQVLAHPDVQKAVKAYNLARLLSDNGKHALEALKQRRDMLVQVGKRQLEEHQGQVRVSNTQLLKELGGKALGS